MLAWPGAASHLLATDPLSLPVLHRPLPDENGRHPYAVCERQALTRQYSDRRALNSTIIVTKDKDLKPWLTADGLAATRGCRERPRSRRAADERDELAPPHVRHGVSPPSPDVAPRQRSTWRPAQSVCRILSLARSDRHVFGVDLNRSESVEQVGRNPLVRLTRRRPNPRSAPSACRRTASAAAAGPDSNRSDWC